MAIDKKIVLGLWGFTTNAAGVGVEEKRGTKFRRNAKKKILIYRK